MHPSTPDSSRQPVRIGVLFGGASGEHAVSIRSARTVVAGLHQGANRQRYQVSCFYIDREGIWWPPAVAETVLESGTPAEPHELPAPAGCGEAASGMSRRTGFGGFPEGALSVDVWFPVLHGPNGEDGTVQGLFTLMGVPYVGSGVLGSALGMDKQAMKAAFAAAGLPQVPYACVEAMEFEGRPAGEVAALLDRLEGELGFPCFVKPANMGSSVGISKAVDRDSLLEGLRSAALHDGRLVVERGVVARELECAVVGTRNLKASVVGEIRFDTDWYDYQSKYSEGLSQVLIPAPLPAAVAEDVRAMAIAACRAVAASGLARVDFFFEEVGGGRLWINEINTLPGFTSQSMYPMLWEASGLPLADLVHELVLGARQWHHPQTSAGGE